MSEYQNERTYLVSHALFITKTSLVKFAGHRMSLKIKPQFHSYSVTINDQGPSTSSQHTGDAECILKNSWGRGKTCCWRDKFLHMYYTDKMHIHNGVRVQTLLDLHSGNMYSKQRVTVHTCMHMDRCPHNSGSIQLYKTCLPAGNRSKYCVRRKHVHSLVRLSRSCQRSRPITVLLAMSIRPIESWQQQHTQTKSF